MPEDGDPVAATDDGGGTDSHAEPSEGVGPMERSVADAGEETEFGWRGWVLVGAVVVSFLVIPWAIVFLPEAQGFLSSLGLGLRDAYLVLPFVPAVVLAGLAVWSAVAHRRAADRE